MLDNKVPEKKMKSATKSWKNQNAMCVELGYMVCTYPLGSCARNTVLFAILCRRWSRYGSVMEVMNVFNVLHPFGCPANSRQWCTAALCSSWKVRNSEL